MNNKLSLKLKYFGGVTNNSVGSNIAAIRAVPNLTDLVENTNTGENGRDGGDNKDRLVLYNIKHNFLSEFAAREEEAVAELKQGGIIAFIDAKHATVSIDKAEDVFARLMSVDPSSDSTDNPDGSDSADSVATISADENVSITADNDGYASSASSIDTVDTANNEASIGNSEAIVDEEIDESGETTETAENTEPEDSEVADDNEVSVEAEDAERNERAYIDNNWDSVVVILTDCGDCCNELNTRLSQLLYYKTLEAGRYDVRLLEDEQDSVPVSSEETVPSSETVADFQESAVETVAETTPETASDTAIVTDAISEDAMSEYEIEAAAIAIIFIIREIFHQYVFVVPNDSFATSTEKKEVMRSLANKPLYLLNPHKNVNATGIMQGDGKRIVVKAGSTIGTENRLPNQKGQTSSASLRQKLIEDGVVVDYRFVTDYEFNSTSAAASVILGQSASGMNTWKDEAGRKLETLLGR